MAARTRRALLLAWADRRGGRRGNNAALSLAAPVSEFGVLAKDAEPTLEGLEVVLGRTRGPLPPPRGLPLSQAELRGVPRFNSDIPGHAIAADAEERLANVVQSFPGEQVVRWGDPIGAHGADVISVNTKTGDVTLWDAKYRGSDVRIQHSTTFRIRANLRPGELSPRDKAIRQARETLEADEMLPPAIRQRALDNLKKGAVKTRTVGYGRALNSTIGS